MLEWLLSISHLSLSARVINAIRLCARLAYSRHAAHTALPWDSEDEWRRAGGRLHTLQGLVRAEPPKTEAGSSKPVGDSIWQDSYEAEQHLLHIGRADEPVCWSLTGFASGYLSRAYGRDIYCIEQRCRGKGDAVCRLIGRPAEEWGDEIKPHLVYYQKDCLDTALSQVTAELKRTEKRLRTKRAADPNAHQAATAGPRFDSPAMMRVIEMARRVAQVDSTVLITGESGSFTGATQDRIGLFESANGGTLFLDEIGDVPPGMQVKLLRALQEKQIRRVGENRTRPVDARVLAATHRNLSDEIHGARFREDLYYRLRVVEISIPPLRERREDILPLARLFLATIAQRTGSKVTGFTPAAAQQLLRHQWPGNVRELENAVERAVVLSRRQRVEIDDLPPEIGLAWPSVVAADDIKSLADVERDYIGAVLRAVEGNRTVAAAKLGIGPATLYRKLKQYNA